MSGIMHDPNPIFRTSDDGLFRRRLLISLPKLPEATDEFRRLAGHAVL